MSKTYIIAEIGINHNGDLDTAKQLIDIAALSRCDAVKFQKRDPDICVPNSQKNILRETPWGTMTYIDYKKKIEFGKKEYDEIDSYTKQKNIKWSASPWDLSSLKFLTQYDIPFIKIPSALLTDDTLLNAASLTGKKIILSTGMSSIEEIDHAVNILTKNKNSFALLHCVSAYPVPLNELNLLCIKTLKQRYNCEVGYSGHEFRLNPSVAAIYLGATIIERHITLDREMWGTDHLSSVEPQGLIKLVRGVRDLEVCLGDGNITVSDCEKPFKDKLRK